MVHVLIVENQIVGEWFDQHVISWSQRIDEIIGPKGENTAIKDYVTSA